ALHLGHIPPRRQHEMTPVLFAAAAAGDPVAGALGDRQAYEVTAMATVAMDRLGPLDEGGPGGLRGGVAGAPHPPPLDGIAARLADRAPKAVPHVVTAPPILGAALLGLDHTSCPPDAADRLRAVYGAR